MRSEELRSEEVRREEVRRGGGGVGFWLNEFREQGKKIDERHDLDLDLGRNALMQTHAVSNLQVSKTVARLESQTHCGIGWQVRR